MTVPEHALYYLEIVTLDVEAACRLYGQAYGWLFQATGPELGNAFLATLPGGTLCAIRAPMSEEEKPTVRTYLRVSDIEAAARDAEQLGDVAHLGFLATLRLGHFGLFGLSKNAEKPRDAVSYVVGVGNPSGPKKRGSQAASYMA